MNDPPSSVDAVALRHLLDGEYRDVREHLRAVLARPEFDKPEEPLPTAEYRELVTGWTRTLASTGGPALLFPEGWDVALASPDGERRHLELAVRG